MKYRRQLWILALVVWVVLAAACAATDVTDPAPLGEPALKLPAGQVEVAKSEPEVAPTIESNAATEGESEPTTNDFQGSEPTPVADVPESEQAPGPASEPTAETPPKAEEILALLDALTVAAEQSDGYDRHLFKHWTDEDGDGCDTRREVLLAEAVVAPAQGSRCSLSGGEWISRYDGLTDEGNGRGFDVDHLVPLAEAWGSGANAWSSDQRERYANDLGYEDALIAVSARSNRSKGAQDPATWLPPEDDQYCWYVAAWVHVKTRWSLTVDTAEVAQIQHVLSTCSDAEIDVGPPAPVVEEEYQGATAEAQEELAAEQEPEQGCHPAYTPCLPHLPGDALNCGDLASDQKPVTVNEIGDDPYRLDRDGDGHGCAS